MEDGAKRDSAHMRLLAFAAILSILMHLLIGLLLAWRPWPSFNEPQTVPVEVTLAEAISKPPAGEKLQPLSFKPAPAEVTKPLETVRPEAIKPSPSKPLPVKPKPQAMARIMGMPKPVLKPGRLAETSTENQGVSIPDSEEEDTQTLRDMILSQVLHYWHPPAEMRGRHVALSFVVDVQPNGMLGSPYAGNRPVDLQNAVVGYDNLAPPAQFMVKELINALRIAQPFTLPSEVLAKAPLSVRLDFRIDDVP